MRKLGCSNVWSWPVQRFCSTGSSEETHKNLRIDDNSAESRNGYCYNTRTCWSSTSTRPYRRKRSQGLKEERLPLQHFSTIMKHIIEYYYFRRNPSWHMNQMESKLQVCWQQVSFLCPQMADIISGTCSAALFPELQPWLMSFVVLTNSIHRIPASEKTGSWSGISIGKQAGFRVSSGSAARRSGVQHMVVWASVWTHTRQ